MSIFVKLEEHLELILSELKARIEHQLSAYGSSDPKLAEVVGALTDHVAAQAPAPAPVVEAAPVVETAPVEAPVVEAAPVEPAAPAVETPAEAPAQAS